MSIATAILADIPQVYWPLDDATGPAAADASGFGRSGAYGGSFTLLQPGPEVGTFAALLASQGNVASIATTPVAVRPWTLDCWIATPILPSTNQSVLSNANGAVNGETQFITPGATFWNSAVVRQGVAFGANAPIFVYDSAYHHLGFSADAAGNVIIYLDGTAVQTQAGQTINATNAGTVFQVGSTAVHNPMYVAHAAIYNTQLSGVRMLAHFNARGAVQNPPGLQAISVADLSTVLADLNAILASVRKVF